MLNLRRRIRLCRVSIVWEYVYGWSDDDGKLLLTVKARR